jgi:hypothetical protein
MIKRYLIFSYFFCAINFNSKSDSYDYSLGYIVDSCKVTTEGKKITGRGEGVNKYRTCMNFIMALSSSLNSRCMMLEEKSLTSKNPLLYADLTDVDSTGDLVMVVINYQKKYPHFSNQLAWLHASKALSQKWPCKIKY